MTASRNTALGIVIGLVVAIAVAVGTVLGFGLLFRYAYDVTVLHTFRSAPRIGVAQAVGLSAFVGWACDSSAKLARSENKARDLAWQTGGFLAFIWILSNFIH